MDLPGYSSWTSGVPGLHFENHCSRLQGGPTANFMTVMYQLALTE